MGKTLWTGVTDADGISVNILLENQKKVYFETTIVQKALGHYDRWLLFNEKKDFTEFMKLCRWLVNHQDVNGGWAVWENLGIKACSKYSAMTQGEVISAMVRAWIETNNDKFHECAERALQLLILPVEKGGTSYFIGNDLILDEVPKEPPNTILNGWIFALMELYDYYLVFKNQKVYKFFRKSLRSLDQHISDYDARYWSFYDIRGHLASHIYHKLHIAQLTALTMIDSKFCNIRKYAKRWSHYQHQKFNRMYSIVVKGIQKIVELGEVTLLK